MEKKVKKIVLIILAAVIVLIIAGFGVYRLVLDRVGDKAMREVIETEIDDMLDSGEITIEDVENIADSINTGETPENTDENITDGSKPANDGKNETDTKKDTPSKPVSRKKTIEKAAEKIEKTIPRSEKDEMMRFVLSRLSADDVRYLSGLLKGGLTAEEKASAKKLAYSRFSSDEIKRVREYYKKYSGMINGAK